MKPGHMTRSESSLGMKNWWNWRHSGVDVYYTQMAGGFFFWKH